MTQSNNSAQRLLKGHLVIYVDGYKYHYRNMVHLISQDGKQYSVPDRLMPPPDEDIDSMAWWENGWAVGENSRDRLCARFGVKPLRKFFDYDEAVSFAYARQQKNKTQQHVLVYVTKGAHGKEERHVVRSLDEVVAIDAANAKEAADNEAARIRQEEERKARYPELGLLQQHYGQMKAWVMADRLAEAREKGSEHVMALMPKGSWYRFVRELRAIGIELPD